MEKRKRLIAALRKETKRKRGDRQACYICKRHILITECHHLVTVAQIADYIERTSDDTYPMPIVWLCPNHHAYLHLDNDNLKDATYSEFSEQEYDAFFKLLAWKHQIVEQFTARRNHGS